MSLVSARILREICIHASWAKPGEKMGQIKIQFETWSEFSDIKLQFDITYMRKYSNTKVGSISWPLPTSLELWVPSKFLQTGATLDWSCAEVWEMLSQSSSWVVSKFERTVVPKFERSCSEVRAKLCRSSRKVVLKFERSSPEVRAKLYRSCHEVQANFYRSCHKVQAKLCRSSSEVFFLRSSLRSGNIISVPTVLGVLFQHLPVQVLQILAYPQQARTHGFSPTQYETPDITGKELILGVSPQLKVVWPCF